MPGMATRQLSKQSGPSIEGPSAFLDAVRSSGGSLRDKYFNDPVGLARKFGVIVPRKPLEVMMELKLYDPNNPEDVEKWGELTPGLADLIYEVCMLAITSALVVGPRGGGKSLGVSFIEFFLVFVKLFDALNLGGSELQADQVYQYILSFIESDPYWQNIVKGEPQISRTDTTDGAWVRVLTASSKSVRSPHAGGKKRNGRIAGGILVIDEEAECAADIVSASLATINTAKPSVNLRSSTFHNAEGSFAELVDNHKEMGYKKYQWTVFDVAERCTQLCEDCEPCFAKDHIERVQNPETGEIEEKLVHKAYCGGLAHYSEGWVPIEEIKTFWRRGNRNHAVFEVEQMGSRPSSSGHVIKDITKFNECIVTDTPDALYKRNCPIDVLIDWGSTNAGLEIWQEQPGDKHVLLEARLLESFGVEQVVGTILGCVYRWPDDFNEIAGDVGGGGSYLNPLLRDTHGLPVRDVEFAKSKEGAAAALNLYCEAHKIIIPAQFEEYIRQHRRWRRTSQGRIEKGNDHLCDAGLCYFSKFIDRLGLSHIRVPPKTFSTNPGTGVAYGERLSGTDRVFFPVRPDSGRVAAIRVVGGRR